MVMRLCLLLLASLGSFAMDKVIFDTDCGYFGDDGSALVMLLRSPDKVELQGITIVSGNVWAAESETYIGQILAALGRSAIRPYVGAQMPLVHTPAMAKLEGPLAFQGAFAGPPKFAQPRSSALDYLASAIQRDPGRITILALGPMTNIAMLLRLHPDLETKIKRIVFMGGNVHVPGNASKNAEFNFWFDPEAARIVLRSRIPEKVMFPLDICNRAVLTRNLFDQIVAARSPITERYRQDFGLRYPGFLKDSKATGYLWDELAAGWLIDTGFVTKSETAFLDVDTAFGPAYGQTTNLDRKLVPDATPVRVMLDLDFPRYFALYKNLLAR
jgi:inosine-uridine nucleoside N-ribohydrolase